MPKLAKLFITCEDITIRIHDQFLFEHTTWTIGKKEQWVIMGQNGSGKSTLAKALSGLLSLKTGKISYEFVENELKDPECNRDAVAYVSFDSHQQLYDQEEFADELRHYAGNIHEGTKVLRILPNMDSVKPYMKKHLKMLDIPHLQKKTINSLSTGEMRKVIIAKALLKDPQLLILDEPFDSLDEAARGQMYEIITMLNNKGLQLVLITHRLDEVLDCFTHVALVKEGKMIAEGKKDSVLNDANISTIYDLPLGIKKIDEMYQIDFKITANKNKFKSFFDAQEGELVSEVFVDLKSVTVKYDDKVVLHKINWEMKRGENWAIIGPNGAGKSTILELITGSNVQAYANKITLFDTPRKELSLDEIKKRISVVSSKSQLQYDKDTKVFNVIASGFFNTVGLYHTLTRGQDQSVMKLVSAMQLNDLLVRRYGELSTGQKRMVLLARALVKSPQLLILDEPTHGLDIKNRKLILDIIETVGRLGIHLLYVTHHLEEISPCITHVMRLEEGKIVKKGLKEKVLK